MKKTISQKLMIIMLIITLVSADFLILGTNIISYATSIDKTTNNQNIEFAAYFKDEEGNKITEIEENTSKTELKLYAEISVKKEGYFNGQIEIGESNFSIKDEKTEGISKIEGNKIELKQINAGNTAEIEIGIEPTKAEEIEIEKLTKATEVKLTGTYMETTYKGKSIKAEKEVKLKIKASEENKKAEVSKEIITNKIYKTSEGNKRIIQMAIKSKITENSYPIKETTITANVPEDKKEELEKIQITGLKTEATNGKIETQEKEWKADKSKENQVQLKVENKGNKISWKRGVQDEYIITYIYKETAEVTGIELKANVEIEIYNESNKLKEEIAEKVGEEKSGIISSETQIDQKETYKGQLYENAKIENKKEIPFNTATKIEIKAKEIVETVKIKTEKDKYTTTGEEIEAKVRYISTQINAEKMKEILGKDGYIQVKNGENITKITQESEKDESGNIVIKYEASTEELEITTSKPIKAGILEIKHEKAIIGDEYTTEQIKTITGLKTTNKLTATIGEETVVESTSEAIKELKETYTKAELEINKANLTTMETNKDVKIGIKLNTYGKQYDLYKNPIIKIQLPEIVQGIKVTSIKKLYGEEFTIEKAKYDSNTKTIEIGLTGEQTKYAESEVEQLYLQITADIEISEIEESKKEKIIITYTNENATKYENNGTEEKEIEIVAQKKQKVVESTGTNPAEPANPTETINPSNPENNTPIENPETTPGQQQQAQIYTSIDATVGQEKIKNGEKVKSGEVIRYKITVENTGKNELANVTLKGLVPEGTVLVVPEEDFEYSGETYYEEKPDIKEYTQQIEKLGAGQEYTVEYEVRVKMDTAANTELANKAIAIYGEQQKESDELKIKTETAKLRITYKNIYSDEHIRLPGDTEAYIVFIENFSDKEQDLEIKLKATGQKLKYMSDGTNEIKYDENNNSVKIEKIPANGSKWFSIQTRIQEDVKEITSYLIGTDKDGNKYRSNKDVKSVEEDTAEIKLTTPNNGEYVNIGDEIVYNLEVKNTSKVNRNISILDNIPEQLEIQEISVNNEVEMQSNNPEQEETYVEKIPNNLEYLVEVEAEKVANVSVKGLVLNPEQEFEVKTITNSAKAVMLGEVKATSEEVSHTIQGTVTTDMKNIVSGIAWLDKNQNGEKDAEDSVLKDVKVMLLDIKKNQIAVNKEGNKLETTTNGEGLYTFNKVENGEYIVIFQYDTEKYEPTIYMKEGIAEAQNSNAVEKAIVIDGDTIANAATDKIEVTDNIFNINIGLKENLKYDLELNKYISKIAVQNKKGTKTYEYDRSTFQKVEIHSKQIANSVVVLEYTIAVTNTGDIAGYVTSIKDYLPNGVTFSSELNPDWYLSGQDLYSSSLANTRIEPGETKEIKLTVSKTMSENNIGLINNRAEIVETYNEYGKLDIDSTVNNQINEEDDLGSADVIIGLSTGVQVIGYTIIVMINTILIGVAIYLIFIKNRRTNK